MGITKENQPPTATSAPVQPQVEERKGGDVSNAHQIQILTDMYLRTKNPALLLEIEALSGGASTTPAAASQAPPVPPPMPFNAATAQANFERDAKQLAVEGHANWVANHTP